MMFVSESKKRGRTTAWHQWRITKIDSSRIYDFTPPMCTTDAQLLQTFIPVLHNEECDIVAVLVLERIREFSLPTHDTACYCLLFSSLAHMCVISTSLHCCVCLRFFQNTTYKLTHEYTYILDDDDSIRH